MSASASLEGCHGAGTGSVYSNTNGMPMSDGKNLHMDLAKGDLSNRVITVGSAARAEIIASFLDESPARKRIVSSRGFTTITGTYKGVPVSVVSIGMGPSMMDFFVRESRAVVDSPMAMVRFGTCGGLSLQAPAGSIVVSSGGSGYVNRNPDAFAHFYGDNSSGSSSISPYNFAKVAPADDGLSKLVIEQLAAAVGQTAAVLQGVNVTADSFYSSQGRIDDRGFDDSNTGVIDAITSTYPGALTMEMESFTLLHLAKCCKIPIVATAAAIVVANRIDATVIDGDTLTFLEREGGRAILEAIIKIKI